MIKELPVSVVAYLQTEWKVFLRPDISSDAEFLDIAEELWLRWLYQMIDYLIFFKFRVWIAGFQFF